MGSKAVEEEGNHEVLKVWEVNQDRIACMQKRISEPPSLLSRAAGRSSCCIFRVPQRLVEINGNSYQPWIVSIGPFHRGQAHLKMIEEHKWRYLGSLLARIQSKGLALEDLLKAIHPLEMEARDCYSEAIHLDTNEFIEMMVLDGCFILELFRKVGKLVYSQPDDPLFTMAWILPYFYRDILRLENQIPYFVLECLFDLTKMPGDEESGPSLSAMALQFFNNTMLRPDADIAKYYDLKGRHLLDLVRMSYIPPDDEEAAANRGEIPYHLIHCVSKLRRVGIELKPGKTDSFLVVKFNDGVIEMPTIAIDDFMSSFLTNCVAYEQSHRSCSKHFTSYTALLDCLVNTDKDVEYLVDGNILANYFGTESEVASFINNLGKDIAFDIENCHLSSMFNDVNQYYRNSWHVQWASLRYTYSLAAVILLVLTFLQTFYTIYSTYK